MKNETRKVESKILNFPDAMRLAKILDSVGVVEVSLTLDSLQLFLSKISPILFLEILCLLTGKSSIELKELRGEDSVVILFVGFQINKINELLWFNKRQGSA